MQGRGDTVVAFRIPGAPALVVLALLLASLAPSPSWSAPNDSPASSNPVGPTGLSGSVLAAAAAPGALAPPMPRLPPQPALSLGYQWVVGLWDRLLNLVSSGKHEADLLAKAQALRSSKVAGERAQSLGLFRRLAAASNIDGMVAFRSICKDIGYQGCFAGESARWLSQAAGTGDPKGLDAQGFSYLDWFEGRRYDYKMAVSYFGLAAAKNDAEGLMQMGLAHELGRGLPKDPGKASEYFMKSAALGYVPAMVAIQRQFLGPDGAPTDGQQWLYWVRRAAEAGDRDSMYSLGSTYSEGTYGTADPAQAFSWVSKSLENSDLSNSKAKDAIQAISHMYLKGEGTPPNLSKVLNWLQVYADHFVADPNPYLILGYIHAAGVSGDSGLANMPRDFAKAERMFALAAQRGDDKSKYLTVMMQLAQIEKPLNVPNMISALEAVRGDSRPDAEAGINILKTIAALPLDEQTALRNTFATGMIEAVPSVDSLLAANNSASDAAADDAMNQSATDVAAAPAADLAPDSPAVSAPRKPDRLAAAAREVRPVASSGSGVTLNLAREQRIEGMLANALARDPTGGVARSAAAARAARGACQTQSCVDRSYAAEEVELRQWQGAD